MDPGDDQDPEVVAIDNNIEDDKEEAVDMSLVEKDEGRGTKRKGAPITEKKFYARYVKMYKAIQHDDFYHSGSIIGRKRTFPQAFETWGKDQRFKFVHNLYRDYKDSQDTVTGSLKRVIQDEQAQYESLQMQRNDEKAEMALTVTEEGELSTGQESWMRGRPTPRVDDLTTPTKDATDGNLN